MKLELKHLAPYLPYGLKCSVLYEGNNLPIMSIYIKENRVGFDDGADGINVPISEDYFKPILRPLSDLPNDHLDDIYEKYKRSYPNADEWTSELRFLRKYGGLDYKLPLFIWDYLFELHYDVFGLIDKGLAIDVNTLDKETKD